MLALLVTYLVLRAWGRRAYGLWALAGLCAGGLTLARPLLVLVVPLAAVAAALVRGRWVERARAAAVVLAAAALLLVPWLAWTGGVTGRVTLSSFGEGWNLLLAAHGEGLSRTTADVMRTDEYRRDFVSIQRFAPAAEDYLRDDDAHGRYLARGDAELRRLALDEYGERLGREPWTVAGEAVYRGYFLWMAHEDWYQPASGVALLGLRLVDWALLALALGGAALAWRAGGPARAIVAFLLLFTALNALHHVEARYAIPVRGLYLALAALPLVALARRRAA